MLDGAYTFYFQTFMNNMFFTLALHTHMDIIGVLDYFEINSANNPLVAFETDNSTHIQCFDVTIIDDTQFEATEEFMFTLSLMGNRDMQSVVVDPYISRVQIVDNDGIKNQVMHITQLHAHAFFN